MICFRFLAFIGGTLTKKMSYPRRRVSILIIGVDSRESGNDNQKYS